MNKEEMTAIQYCEETYPQTCEEFKDILDEMYTTFCKKNILDEMYTTFCKKQRNYGPGNISVGTPLATKEDVKLSLSGLWFRKNDKINRLKQLVVLGQPDEVGESIEDTYEDLAVYSVISLLVNRGKWAK